MGSTTNELKIFSICNVLVSFTCSKRLYLELSTAIRLSNMSAPRSDVHGFKADARESRMKLPNTLHERIFAEWQKMAVKACDDEVRAYWVCRQENGFSVVWKCREQNDAMQKCVADYTRDDVAFERYKARRLDEMSDEVEKRKAARDATLAAKAATGGAGAPAST